MLNFLFYLCVAALTLGQFSSVYGTGSGNIYLFDATMAVFALGGVVSLLAGKKSLIIPRNLYFFVLFVLVAVVSLVRVIPFYSGENLLLSSFYLWRFVFILLSAVVLFNMIKQGSLEVEKVLMAFFISGLLISVAGFIQLAVLPDFTTLDPSLGWDPHKNRLASVFFDPNFTGAYLVMCFTLLFHSRADLRLKSLFFLIFSVAIFLTFSRSAWLMWSVVILIEGLFRYRLLLVLACILAFSAYFAVPRVQTRISGATDPSDSAKLRFVSWNNTIAIAKDHIWLGTGFNTFRYVQKDYGFLDADTETSHAGAGSDSSLLLVLATTGIAGAAVYLLNIILSLFRALVTRSHWDILLMGITLGLLLESFFINSLFYPQILFLWLIVLMLPNCFVSDK